mmetsp:Transcript_2679/g.11483  ORF Transcript_2679/g.11483 Transcript_2679/m.11483 type:complete len:533 (-) Transcript_2679:881-2479(-)
MAPTTIHVKATSGSKITVSVELSTTVGELKTTLEAADKADTPSAQQRLIYKGHVLKDEKTLESYGVGEDHVIHLVKGPAPGGAAPAPAQTATRPPSTPATNAANSAANPFGAFAGAGAGAGAMGGMGAFGGMGGMGGMPDLQQMQQQMAANPQAMQELMNSPAIRSYIDSIVANPESVRAMMESNPQMREIMDRNPELRHALNDPETLRRTFEVARNPSLMREQMRQHDRMFANVEAHPEGFNALARAYTDVQAPMMNAMASGRDDGVGNTVGGAQADNPFAALFGANENGNAAPGATAAAAAAAPGAEGSPNTSPLPNPWAPNAGSGAGSTSAPAPAGLPGLGGAPMGMGGMGNATPDQMMSQMEAILSNPAMANMMQSMMSNPAVMQQMIDSDPRMRAMLDAAPGMREQLTNPEFLRQMTNPDNLRAMMQMQRAMTQLQGNGVMPPGMGMPGAAGGGSSGVGAGAGAANPFAALMGGGAPPVADARPPEEAYASQLQQLKDMGFFDEAQNIRALQATFGNVSAAIERLLQ